MSAPFESAGARAQRERDALRPLARDMSAEASSTRRTLVQLAETAQAFTAAEGARVLDRRDEAIGFSLDA